MKRQTNTTAIKFKFIGETNTRPSRYKVTQTNTNKSIFISADFYNLLPHEGIYKILENHPDIVSFTPIVDNTQNDYFLFCIEIANKTTFPDLLKHIQNA
jgi:hypothetical protein